jgi:hypothetical protein
MRNYMREWLRARTPEQIERIVIAGESTGASAWPMTPEERKRFHQAIYRNRIAAENESQRANRLKKERDSRRKRLASETPEQRVARLRKARQRDRRRRREMSAAEPVLRLKKRRAYYRRNKARIRAYQRRYYAERRAAAELAP